jgi:translation initiation factor 2-alpha kinase 3
LTGSERWNFSVGSHELALAGLTEGCYQAAEEVLDYENTKHLFKMLIPEGIIFGADAENKIVWQHKFDSPISQAWTLEKGRLQIVDPIRSAPVVDDIPSLYVGIHKQQLYVQESHPTVVKLKTKFELDFIPEEGQKTIEWKPNHGKPALPSTEDPDKTALAPLYAGPFFVYDRDEIGYTPAIEGSANFSFGDEDELEEAGTDAIVLIGLSTLWFWWKEVLGISLLTAVILNILLMRPLMRIVRRKTIGEMTLFFRNMMNREEQNRQALLPRVSTSEESILSAKERERSRTLSSSSSHSQSPHGEDQMVPFNSQYLREFEPIQCLGRGGFGVVFEARKKIDDRNYAVKRIALPSSEKSRDRVMREVKALAKLDHKNIVRYFNAWIENPPMGWLEKSDPLWNAFGALGSPSPTCDYPSDFVGSGEPDSMSVFRSIRDKKNDHLEITVPDKTPCEDSFIVFAASSIEEVDEDDDDGIIFREEKSVSVCIGRVSNGSFEENNSYSKGNSSIDDDDSISKSSGGANGKFFARPTTLSLNIPSSDDNGSWGRSEGADSKQSDDLPGSEEPLSIMYLYIQQELCQKRTLQEWLRAEKERNLRHVIRIFAQIVEAVEYIHSHHLIHRDLKPSNIFLAGESGQDEEMTAKIGDFGLATTLVQNKLTNEETQGERDGGSGLDPANFKLTGHVGTHLYMSPEQNLQKPYDYKVDIYSLGLIFFELLVPFSTDMERYDFLSRIRKLQFPNLFVDSHPEEYKLIKQMVSHRPERRPDTPSIRVWLKNRIEALHSNATTAAIPTLRSKSFPSPIFVEEAISKNLAKEKLQNGKQFYKAHSFQ